MSKPLVSVVSDRNTKFLVRRALDLVNFSAKTNSKVLIKPNLVRVPSQSPYINEEGSYEKTWAEDGDVVHPEIIKQLLVYLNDKGIKNVTIAEGSGGCETSVAFRALGLYEMAEKFGAQLLDLNHADSTLVPIKNGVIMKNCWIPKIIFEADFRISLTVLKVHGNSCVSLCLKNWALGIPPCKYYGANKGLADHYRGLEDPLPIHPKKGEWQRGGKYGQCIELSKAIVEICSVQGFDLGIIDGLTAVHYKSLANKVFAPSIIERSNMVIASTDMVAADAVATRIIGLDPKKILHIKWAVQRKLGTADLSKIEIRGKKIEEVEMRCVPMYRQKSVMLPAHK
jgi:uncharacterized protein (DUF362 family)